MNEIEIDVLGIPPSHRTIIRTYQRLRTQGQTRLARMVAMNLGYSIDQNGTNTFVERVIRKYVRSCQRK